MIAYKTYQSLVQELRPLVWGNEATPQSRASASSKALAAEAKERFVLFSFSPLTNDRVLIVLITVCEETVVLLVE